MENLFIWLEAFWGKLSPEQTHYALFLATSLFLIAAGMILVVYRRDKNRPIWAVLLAFVSFIVYMVFWKDYHI